jgi:hypothetical protein
MLTRGGGGKKKNSKQTSNGSGGESGGGGDSGGGGGSGGGGKKSGGGGGGGGGGASAVTRFVSRGVTGAKPASRPLRLLVLKPLTGKGRGFIPLASVQGRVQNSNQDTTPTEDDATCRRYTACRVHYTFCVCVR